MIRTRLGRDGTEQLNAMLWLRAVQKSELDELYGLLSVDGLQLVKDWRSDKEKEYSGEVWTLFKTSDQEEILRTFRNAMKVEWKWILVRA